MRRNEEALLKKVSLDHLHARQGGDRDSRGDGYFRAVIARLVEHPILELHEYIRILLESRVKVPVVVL